MLNVSQILKNSEILFLGAHTDDIEIGAGGLLFLALQEPTCKVHYLSFSLCRDLPRNINIREDQERILSFLREERINSIGMLNFRNKHLSAEGEHIRKELEKFSPDIVVTHSRNDLHQDHKAIMEETTRVFKKQTILEYEIPHSCSNFSPDLFIGLSIETFEKKLNLIEMYQSQKDVYYIGRDKISATAKFRGLQCGYNMAEAYKVNKVVL